MTDDAAVFLTGTRQEARAVNEGDHRDVVGVADADVSGDLVRGVDIQRAGHAQRLVGDDTDGVAVHARKADNGVGGVVGLDFEEAVTVEDRDDGVADVVGRVCAVRDQAVEGFVSALDRVFRDDARRFFVVVLWQVGEQLLDHRQTVFLGFGREVGDAAGAGMYPGTAEVFRRDLFAGHCLDDFRPGEEHVALAGHDDEVGQRRGVHRTTGAGAEDDGNLRDDAGGHDVTHENLTVGGEAAHAFLDTRTAGITEADQRNADFQRTVGDAADFL